MTIVSPRRRRWSRAFFHGGLASTVAFALADMNLAATATSCIAGAAIIAIGSASQPNGGLRKRIRFPLAALAMSVPALLFGQDALSVRETAVVMADVRAEIKENADEYRRASDEFKALYDADEIRHLGSSRLQYADLHPTKSFDARALSLMPAVGAVLAGDLSLSEAREIGGDWPAASRLVHVAVDRPQFATQTNVGVLQCWADGKELVAMRPIFQTYETTDTSHRRFEKAEWIDGHAGIVRALDIPHGYDLSNLAALAPLNQVCEDVLQRDL